MTSHLNTNRIRPETSSIPTLFRIPQIGGGETAPAKQAESESHDPSTAANTDEGLADASDSIQEREVSAGQQGSSGAYPSSSASYDSLPELPPLEEPAGRTWMETVGSRVVLALLFLAIGTVAIMATRDVPPIAGSTHLADEDLQLDIDAGSAERIAQVNEPNVGIEDPYPIESSIPAPATELIRDVEIEQGRDLSSNSGDQAMLIPTLELSPSGAEQTGLPEVDAVDDGLEATMPALPPLPGFAESEDGGSAELSTDDVAVSPEIPSGSGGVRSNPLADQVLAQSQGDEGSGSSSDSGGSDVGNGLVSTNTSATDAIVETAPSTEGSDGMAEAEAIVAKLELPASEAKESLADYRDAWKNTITPEPIESWKDFRNQPATPVGYNEVPGQNQPIAAPSSGMNQFAYPSQPVQPNSLAPTQPFAPIQQQSPAPYYNPYQAQTTPPSYQGQTPVVAGAPGQIQPQNNPFPYNPGPSPQPNSPPQQGLVYVPGQGHVQPNHAGVPVQTQPMAARMPSQSINVQPPQQQNPQQAAAWNGYTPPINYGQPAAAQYPAPGQYYPGGTAAPGVVVPQN